MAIRKFTKDRDWDQFHSPANLAKSIMIEEVDAMSDEQFLTKIKLMINGKITHAGMLLLGNSDYDYMFQSAPSIMWRLYGADNMDRDYAIFKIPFINVVDKVFAKVRNLTYRYMPNQMTLFPMETEQYDSWLMRELLNNCIAHSNYQLGGRIYVNEFEDRLKFTKSDFYMDTFDFPIDEDYLKNILGNNTPTWSSYFDLFSEKLLDMDTQTYYITSFAQFLHIGLSIMMSGEMVIRKCKLCNGYFQTKHSSDQMYCSRIYKNTSATCSEVGVRKTYKEKLFQHPIHQEFTKSYNKLYGRIRRGKVPNDTPLMEQLKKLHDEYTEKYENTHKKDREAVWKEYIQKNKELLG